MEEYNRAGKEIKKFGDYFTKLGLGIFSNDLLINRTEMGIRMPNKVEARKILDVKIIDKKNEDMSDQVVFNQSKEIIKEYSYKKFNHYQVQYTVSQKIGKASLKDKSFIGSPFYDKTDSTLTGKWKISFGPKNIDLILILIETTLVGLDVFGNRKEIFFPRKKCFELLQEPQWNSFAPLFVL